MMGTEKKKAWMIRNMPEQAIRNIKSQAAQEGRSVGEVLVDAINVYLNNKIKVKR